jgi:plastocyanin
MKGETMKRWLLAVPMLVLAVTACGGDEPNASAAPSDEPVVVSAIDNEFDPAEISAAAGSAIEVTNDGEAPHNFSVAGSDIDVDIEPGESVSVDTSDLEAGTHDVECKFHAGAGMTATLTLE